VDPTISCGECAAVCCRLLVVLMPDDDVPVQMIDRDDRDLEVMARRDDGWCTALDRDTLRCTIYARRPFICREYEMGASECRVDRADWRRIALVVCD
jgi:Fe-S-cluster containining protein